MNIQSFEMDARRAGIQAGLAQGRSEVCGQALLKVEVKAFPME
ncbi:hypothetical protein [Treponema pedis]|nr:hypothetical protein [Treponema pedis]